MWQGACRDAATDRLLKIYNVIDYIVCCQPQKALLRDSRSYFGTTLESNHRLVVACIDASRLFSCWGRTTRTSRKTIRYATDRYATDRFADPEIRARYRTKVQQRLAGTIPSATYVQDRWNAISEVICSSAADTISAVPNTNTTKRQEHFYPSG